MDLNVNELDTGAFVMPDKKAAAPAAPAGDAVEALEALVASTYGILPPEGKARFCSYMAGFLEREVVQP